MSLVSSHKKKNFAVVIACHSRSKTIRDTLDSISQAVIPEELEKVIVVENGGENRLEATVLEFQGKIRVEFIHTEKKGKSVALNIAIQHFIPDDSFILFTDDDVRVNPNWMINYRDAFIKYGKGHYFGSAMDVDYEREPDPDIKPLLPGSATGLSDSMFISNSKLGFLGCNWAAHKEDLVQAGLFNPDFGPGSRTGAIGQETSMQRRLRKAGIKRIFIGNNYVWHKVPAEKCSWNWMKKRAERYGRERFLSLPVKSKLGWMMRRIKNICFFTIKSMNGKKYYRYRLIINAKHVSGFLQEALLKR